MISLCIEGLSLLQRWLEKIGDFIIIMSLLPDDY
jgi:hypothetical protein